MKIKMNGKYRLRGYEGDVNIITINSGDTDKPVVGITQDGMAYNWSSKGIFNSAGEESCLDLVDDAMVLHEQIITLPVGSAILELNAIFAVANGYDIDLVAISSGDVDLDELIKIESVCNDIKNTILNLDNWDKK